MNNVEGVSNFSSRNKNGISFEMLVFVRVMKYLPLREPISARKASDRVLRTRRARGGFVFLRTLDAGDDAPRGALDTSRAATLKISFHFFAAPPQTPPPLGERNCKEIFGLLATSPFKKLHSNLHLLESFSFRFFYGLVAPEVLRAFECCDILNLRSQTRQHLA